MVCTFARTIFAGCSLHCRVRNTRQRGVAASRAPVIAQMSSTAAPADGPVATLHAATPQELAAARAALEQAGPLLARKPGTNDAEVQPLSLRYQGEASSSSPACGAGGSSLDAQRYYAALDSRGLGRLLLTAGCIGSTQEVVQENVTRLPDGLVFVADQQAGGKGRGGNTWTSPGGCLMFSAFRRLEIPGQRLPFVQYLVSLAVVQAAQAEAACALASSSGAAAASSDGSAPASSIDVRIKWPNDVYAGPLKIGGVLCHSSYRDRRFHVTMGVGLNVANAQPTTCLDTLTAQAAAAAGAPPPPPLSREALLAGVLSRLDPMLERLAAEGFGPFEQQYYDAWLHSGQRVLLQEEGGQVPVVIRGLSPYGYLLAADESTGEQYELHPDGNSFDFFQGLVRAKLPAAQP